MMSDSHQHVHDETVPDDLLSVHQRLLAEGDAWRAEQMVSTDQLRAFLRQTSMQASADTRVTYAAPDLETDGPASLVTIAAPQPGTWRHRLPRALPAVAALVLISLAAAVFGLMAHTRQQPEVTTHFPRSRCAPNQIRVYQLQGVELSDLAMVSPDEGWALAFNVASIGSSPDPSPAGSGLFHYANCQWLPVPTDPPGIVFTGISMLSAHDGWAVGLSDNTTILLHYNGNQWQRAPLLVTVPQGDSITDLHMFSAKEGWIVVSGSSLPVKLYHGVDGVWAPVSLGYVVPEYTVPFAPDEAWIVSLEGDLLLYRDGTTVPFDSLLAGPGPVSAGITMNSPQDGWLLEAFPSDPSIAQTWTNPYPAESTQDQGWASRTLWHFNGTGWTDDSALINDPRIQTALYAQIFSGQEGWAFPVDGDALWLRNGHWKSVPWPEGLFNGIVSMTQVSPVEYWAIASYAYTGQGKYDALLHFVNGAWSVYS
jgi:hypothetical protein